MNISITVVPIATVEVLFSYTLYQHLLLTYNLAQHQKHKLFNPFMNMIQLKLSILYE